jgi:peptide/nickel transport system permease protein
VRGVARLIARRVLLAALTLWLVSLVTFWSIEAMPGDAATRFLGRDATPEAVTRLRERLHLDRPAPERYGRWLTGILRGDLGPSLASNRPVAVIVGPRLRNTLTLAGLAFLLHLPAALIPAAVAALNRDRPIDHVISAVNLVAVSLPSFLIATLLLVGLVVIVPLFPAVSSVYPGMPPAQRLRVLTLPALTLAIVMAAYALRMLRDNLVEVLDSEYVRMAELKGLSPRRILLRHALPNALGPTLNITALNVAYLVSGVVIVEKVFAFPGFGTTLVDSILVSDTPVVQACVLIAAAVYIGANLLADVGALLFHPRLREAG